MSGTRAPRWGIGAASICLAASLAMVAAPAGSQAADATAATMTTTLTNGGLGWSGGYTARQRLDELDGSTDELPANVGPDALFNRAGDAILAYRGGTMYVLRANGVVEGYPASSVPSALHGSLVAWAADESYAVVVTEDGVYRVAPGQRPVVLPDYFGGGMPRSGDGQIGLVADTDDSHVALYVADPLRPENGRTRISPEWCTYPLDSGFCAPGDTFVGFLYPVGWDAAGDRILVGYQTYDGASYAERLAWFTPHTTTLQDIGFSDESAGEIFLSPDDALLAYNHGTGRGEGTTVVTVSDGSQVTEFAGHHWGWQPCAGPCASFDEPVSPSRVPIGKAASGRKGGKVTATVRWRAPAHAGTTPIDRFMLEATPVGSPAGRHTMRTDRGPGARSYRWKLSRGRWKFRVCAYNSASPYCTISAFSNIVRAR